MNCADKKTYSICECTKNVLTVKRNGKEFLRLPASCSVNDMLSDMSLVSFTDEAIVYASENETMTFLLSDDDIRVKFEKRYTEDTPIFIAKMFLNADMGMDLIGFDRSFNPQPRNNRGANMDYYHHLPDISQNGYYTPTVLEISIGSPDGWVSLGLLDLPDSKICKMDEDHSFLLESCGGNKVIKAGAVYAMPEVVITFPKDEWDAITVFRNKLIQYGRYTPKKKKFSELPTWWKHPLICTYGDQMLEDIVGKGIDEKWTEDIVARNENEWGIENFNLLIDDSWQYLQVAVADEERFPDFRGFIERMHKRGHHVILWHALPHECTAYPFETLGKKHGILSEQPYKGFPFLDSTYLIDFTADGVRAYFKEFCRTLFGAGEGQYNADGVKLDFLANFRDPVGSTYAHPERGMGMKEVLHAFEIFYEEAKKVKPDVLIDASMADPRFEHVLDLNRLHDTHSGNIEKDHRAKISTLACPDLPIDSDGALMLNRWLKTNFINASIYGIPSNYYTKQYHDAAISENAQWCAVEGVLPQRCMLLPEEKRKLANLFKLTTVRPDGCAVLDENGNWMLVEDGKINAITQRGETVVYYPTDKNDTGYIYTFQDEPVEIPLYGRKIGMITPPPVKDRIIVDYARDRVILKLKVGEVHTFKDVDEGNSVDNIFKSKKNTGNVETEINYVVNG